jgi:hypothetical protein
MPYLPITLISGDQSITLPALVDSGASINALPYSVGLQLGLVWADQEIAMRLTGNLARIEARGIRLAAKVGDFEIEELVFAWARSDELPPVLGQVNFFMAVDVCFFREQQAFEITAKR